MATKVRVNLANAQELFELPGLGTAQVAAIVIVRFRSEHGPIKDADQLATILSGYPPTWTSFISPDSRPILSSHGTIP